MSQRQDFAGKTVLVTGAGGGIGGATVRKLVQGVDCISRSSCTAVGSASVATGSVPFTETLVAGKWVPRVLLAVAPNADDTGLTSVSCPQPGACIAVGDYKVTRVPHPFAEVQSASGWQSTTTMPARGGLSTVSCGSPTFCVATYQSGNRTQLAVLRHGQWTSKHLGLKG
jgi:hypothetical protein